jgi:hypothetical protein
MYFFSGEDDAIVPISSPRRMAKLLTEAGVMCEMHAIKNSGHLQALFDRDAMDQAFAFADAHLKGDKTESRPVLGPEAKATTTAESRPKSFNVGGDAEARDGN